jgi:hypothetical protein
MLSMIAQVTSIVDTPQLETYSRHQVKMQAPPKRKDDITVALARDADAKNHP